MQSVNRRQLLSIAWPIILSNLSTPLLGLVDTAVIGNLGDPALLGALAIGGIIFSFLYWGFGFLRMGTTGLVAQAKGAGEKIEEKAAFYRAFLFGLLIGCFLLVLQYPIATLVFSLLDGSELVERAAYSYFEIRIWTAPLTLAHLALIGYLLGQQDTRSVLLIQIVLNGTNIILDFLFVLGFGWGVPGVAIATIASEFIAFSLGLLIVLRGIGPLALPIKTLFKLDAIKRMLSVNRDIMIRTLCLIFAFSWFTNEGAQAGDITLSSNAILMQLVAFSAFFLDGFALAAETLVGSAVGEKNTSKLRLTIRYCTELGLGTAAILSLSYWLMATWIVELLTNIEAVRMMAGEYLIWAILSPVISVWCYLLDGIFIGATRTSEMRNAMIISLAAFLGTWFMFDTLLEPAAKNHGLWASLQVYFIMRAATLAFYLPRLVSSHPPSNSSFAYGQSVDIPK